MAGTRYSCCSMHGAKAGVCVAENANVAEERKCGKKNEKIKNKAMAGTRYSCCSMHGAKTGVCAAENANVAKERKCGKKINCGGGTVRLL